MSLAFFVPPDDLDLAVPDGSDPTARALHTSTCEALELWRRLPPVPVTAEALTWLSLLAKCVDLLAALRAAHAEQCQLALHAADRVGVGVHLHLHSIVAPLVPAWPDRRLTKPVVDAVRRNLRIYAVWSLDNELRLLDELLDLRTLEDLFEGQTARALAQRLGASLQAYESAFGEVPLLSDSELALDRQRYDSAVRQERAELESIIDQLGLRPLLDRLRKEIQRGERPTSTQPFSSALAVLGGGKSHGMAAALRHANLRFSYSGYVRSSQALHASHLGLDVLAGGKLAPRSATMRTDERVQALAVSFRQHLLRLAVLFDYLGRSHREATGKSDA